MSEATDTVNILQELLAIVERRSAKLGEMKNKSLELIERSRQFYEETKKFRKGESVKKKLNA